MRTTINHAVDVLLRLETGEDEPQELIRTIKRVQRDYLEIIGTALSLLVQGKEDECADYLNDERKKLEPVKLRIAELVGEEGRWEDDLHRMAIEYLYTRARLVDEIRMFPRFAMQLLERLTLDESLEETITYLEEAMTGKQNLFNNLVNSVT